MIVLHPLVKQVVCVVAVAILDQGIKEITRIATKRYAGGPYGPQQGPQPINQPQPGGQVQQAPQADDGMEMNPDGYPGMYPPGA